MKKRKSWIKSLLCLTLVPCFALALTGCAGVAPDDMTDGDEDYNSFMTEMYGTKVLYRPDAYDYDSGASIDNGQTNEYYGQYAHYIMAQLFYTYGITGTDYTDYLPDFNVSWGDQAAEMQKYLYDSIRYLPDTQGFVTKRQTVDESGSPVGDPIDIATTEQYTVMGANQSVQWNFTLSSEVEDFKPYLYQDDITNNIYSIQENGHVYLKYDSQINSIESYYDDLYQQTYVEYYLGTTDAEDYANYSDYVKALEFAIYRYAIDLKPEQVSVSISNDGSYVVSVAGFSSVDEALEDAKSDFRQLGTYVGLSDRQSTKIQNWVIENVIGQNAVSNDTITIYSGVIEEVNEQGELVGYDFSQASRSVHELGRDYNNAVKNVMVSVCENVPIGKDGDEYVTIDNRFLASHVMEYSGNTILIQDDANFPKYVEGQPSTAILPLEYQSLTIMLKEDIYISGLWIPIKYDADLSGTVDGDFGSEYIDVIVDLNYYNHETNTRRVVDSKQIRVYDGSYDMNYLYGFEGQEMPVSDGSVAPRDHCSGVVFELDNLHVNAFNVDIGNDILKTDVGRNDYSNSPLVSKDPLILVGSNSIRKYYEIVEYGSNPEFDKDELEDGYTYTSGRFNNSMFSGDDGCDYIEITYKVIKEAGNMTKNYKFYTGIANIIADDKPF